MKTYNIKLEFENQADKNRLMETLKTHQSIWNYLSNYVFNSKTKLSGRIVHEKTYYECRNIFPESPSQIIIRAREDVVSTFKTIKSNKHKIESAPVKHNLSIRLDKRLFTIKGNSIKLTTNGKKALATFNPYPKFKELIEKYPICDPLIFARDNQIWLAVTFNNTVIQLPDNHCIGVDLGIKRTATTSEGIIIVDKAYLKQRRRIRYIKRQINSKKKQNIHNLKKGNSCRKHLKKIRRHEKNLSKNYIHHVTNKVLNTKANCIVIEDLSKIKSKDKGTKFNNKQSQVPYFMLKQILSYKAQALGKRVETVNPAYTSKNDFRGIEDGKRVGCRYYASDGQVLDADLNASINIANRYASKVKLPVSFVFPVDGKYKLNGQAPVNEPNVLCP
ncbi:MAG: transposase [Synergistaceae bacterium]